MGRNAQRRREQRDLNRVAHGQTRRTSIQARRKGRANNVRKLSATELMARDQAVAGKLGLLLPPQVSGGLVIARRKVPNA
jgi:hypothetical protein